MQKNLANEHQTRRDLLRAGGACLTASALPYTAVSLMFAPRIGFSMDPATIQAGIAVANALGLFGSGDGSAEAMAAMNLKLDQILRNQERMMKALVVLQDSIDKLSKDIPGFIEAESFRQMWAQAFAHFSNLTAILGRNATVMQMATDSEALLLQMRQSVYLAEGNVVSASDDALGIAPLLSASRTMTTYARCLYAIANLESNLPAENQWKGSRADSLVEMSGVIRRIANELVANRIVEAKKEVDGLLVRLPEDIAANVTKDAFAKMLRLASGVVDGQETAISSSIHILTIFSAFPDAVYMGWEIPLEYRVYTAVIGGSAQQMFLNVNVVGKSFSQSTWQIHQKGPRRQVRGVETVLEKENYLIFPGGNAPDLENIARNAKADLDDIVEKRNQILIRMKVLDALNEGCKLVIKETERFDQAISQLVPRLREKV